MKLFISWSGPRSRILAESLHHWIPLVLNAADPWLSSYDINPGNRWGSDLAGQLEKTRFGIICLTNDNLKSIWIHYEAGALSKAVDQSQVVPLLLDNKPTDVQGPLAQFQAIQVVKGDILKLLAGINLAIIKEGEKGIEKGMLEESFEVWWPKLEKSLSGIPAQTKDVQVTERSEKEMIEEILGSVRQLQRQIRDTNTQESSVRVTNWLHPKDAVQAQEAPAVTVKSESQPDSEEGIIAPNYNIRKPIIP